MDMVHLQKMQTAFLSGKGKAKAFFFNRMMKFMWR